MERKRGFVVITEAGDFYKNAKTNTSDINKAKDFQSYATAKRISKKINGTVREVLSSYYSTS